MKTKHIKALTDRSEAVSTIEARAAGHDLRIAKMKLEAANAKVDMDRIADRHPKIDWNKFMEEHELTSNLGKDTPFTGLTEEEQTNFGQGLMDGYDG